MKSFHLTGKGWSHDNTYQEQVVVVYVSSAGVEL